MIIKPISIKGNGYKELIKIEESTSKFNENWLQKVIHDNPQSYPIENPLNSDMKIISLGREINSGAGYIDILLLTSEAQLIIVETKLWRNPEKSRTVLAQVIDYAKELYKWGYNELNDAVISAQRNLQSFNTQSLKDIIKKEFSNQNLTDFLEILTQNLQRGIMSISIIGDRISPNLILLSDTIQSSPGLNFRLTLVEMKLFSLGEEIIMIPDIIGKTLEVVRGIVKVQYEHEKPKVEVVYSDSEESKLSPSKTDKRTFLSQCPADISPILDSWLENMQNKKELMIYWGVSGLSIRKILNGKWITLVDVYPYAISLITQDMANRVIIPTDTYDDYLNSIFSIEGLKSAYSGKRRYIKYNTLDTEEITILIDATGKLIDKVIELSLYQTQ